MFMQMFSEDLDWDVPENIQALNKVVFHLNIPGKNKVRTEKALTLLIVLPTFT